MERNIYFRGIDLTEISANYNKGDYTNMTASLFTKDVIVKNSGTGVITQNVNNIQNKSYIGKLGEGSNYICLGYTIYDNCQGSEEF